jgi:hypothetical protein
VIPVTLELPHQELKMLCAIIGYHPTACMTQQATKNETSAKTLASLF